MTKTIYLCGGIADLSSKEQNNWRDKANKELYPRYKILNPMRRNFRDDEFQSQNEIVSLDKSDVIEADLLLVNGTKPSWGTAMEVMFAYSHHKVIVAFTGDKYMKSNPWLAFHSTRVTETLNEALEYIKKHF